MKKFIIFYFLILSLLSFGKENHEERILNLVNSYRISAGIKPLKNNPNLKKLADLKANDMAKYKYFDHTSKKLGTISKMLKKNNIKYRFAGENIAKGQTSPEEVVAMWMASKGHRKNILNPNFHEIGIGIDGYSNNIWTQLFIGD